MASLLYVLFFVSGATALIFEMLWFRQAGLTLGNSVWASSPILPPAQRFTPSPRR